jgi:type IV pilus assembly protein PilV
MSAADAPQRVRPPDRPVAGAAPSWPVAHTGFTLIEVLVTLLLLSLGVLGSAALQLKALQTTHSAYQRSLASVLAIDAGERLWLGLAQGSLGADWLADWRDRRSCEIDDPHVCLPELEATFETSGSWHVITLSWTEGRLPDVPAGRSELEYRLELLPERLP